MRAQAPSAPLTLPDAQQVISYLDQTIDWYRNVAVEEELATDSADVLFLNDNRHLARQIAQLSFDFGHASADYLSRKGLVASTTEQSSTPNRYQALFQAAAKADARVRSAQD